MKRLVAILSTIDAAHMTYHVSLGLSNPDVGGMTLFTIKTENPLPRSTWIDLVVLIQCYFYREPFEQFYERVLWRMIMVAEIDLSENLQSRSMADINELVEECGGDRSTLYFIVPIPGAHEYVDACEDFYAQRLMEILYDSV